MGRITTAMLGRWASLRAIGALILREVASTNGRMPGGYLWALGEPAAGIALLTGLFSIGFHAPPLGVSFPVFYATGIIPYFFYLDISNKVGLSMLFSRSLLGYPAVTAIDAILARFVLNLATQSMVAILLLAFLLLTFAERTHIDPGRASLAFGMAAVLALGVGTLNAFLILRFPVWQRVWSILNRPLFPISCTFFLFSDVPQPWQSVLWYNPLIHVIGQTRAALYPFYDASHTSPIYVFGLGGGGFVLGLVLLRHGYHDLMQA